MNTSVVMCGSVRSLHEFHYLVEWIAIVSRQYEIDQVVWSTWDDVFVGNDEAVAAWRAKGFDIVTSNAGLLDALPSLNARRTSALAQSIQLQAALGHLRQPDQILKVRTDLCASRLSLLHPLIHRGFRHGLAEILVHHVSTLVPFDVADLVYMGPASKIAKIGLFDPAIVLREEALRDLPTESLMFGGWHYENGAPSIRSAIRTMAQPGFRDRICRHFDGGDEAARIDEIEADLAMLVDYYGFCAAEFRIGTDRPTESELFVEDIVLGRALPGSSPYREKNAQVSQHAVFQSLVSQDLRYRTAAGGRFCELARERSNQTSAVGRSISTAFFAGLRASGRLRLFDREIDVILRDIKDPTIFELIHKIIYYVASSGDVERSLYWVQVSISFGLEGFGIDCLRKIRPDVLADPAFRAVSLSRSDANAYLAAASGPL